jgi:fructose-bisphosphate aldolase class II
VIIYNVDIDDDAQVKKMMSEGEKVLSKIPGVRRVITGNAVQNDAKYKFTWLIEFVHENVIDSYRNHPDHVAFADNLFRPVASDRISIDYLEN